MIRWSTVSLLGAPHVDASLSLPENVDTSRLAELRTVPLLEARFLLIAHVALRRSDTPRTLSNRGVAEALPRERRSASVRVQFLQPQDCPVDLGTAEDCATTSPGSQQAPQPVGPPVVEGVEFTLELRSPRQAVVPLWGD